MAGTLNSQLFSVALEYEEVDGIVSHKRTSRGVASAARLALGRRLRRLQAFERDGAAGGAVAASLLRLASLEPVDDRSAAMIREAWRVDPKRAMRIVQALWRPTWNGVAESPIPNPRFALKWGAFRPDYCDDNNAHKKDVILAFLEVAEPVVTEAAFSRIVCSLEQPEARSETRYAYPGRMVPFARARQSPTGDTRYANADIYGILCRWEQGLLFDDGPGADLIDAFFRGFEQWSSGKVAAEFANHVFPEWIRESSDWGGPSSVWILS